ncbi:helix-turn-helix domain-containing protein [Paracoccus yeei]|jgi:excisionase family DNA binding protein|uniref:helix-turn-helix domain-containing protein n=1 Tax=Paracoccus yeei TaxID=147645 RepID=UPI003BF781AA
MNALAIDAFSKRLPSRVEIENADHLRQIIASVIEDDDITLKVVHEKGQPPEPIILNPAIAQTFLEVLRLISSGSGFMMIPVTAELTTQQAADLLNVSRPFLVKLLEENMIPFRKVGRHRRVKAEDLFAYKERRDRERSDALDKMALLDAEAGLI